MQYHYFYQLLKLAQQAAVDGFEDFLIAHPDAAHSKNENSFPIIHRLCMLPSVEPVALLVSFGVDVNLRDNNLRTPLHVAAGWSTLLLVQRLVELGADISAGAKDELTPLDFAIDNFYADRKNIRREIVAYLVSIEAPRSKRGIEISNIIAEFEGK